MLQIRDLVFDAWGRRFTYGLDTQFGRDPGQGGITCTPNAPVAAGFALCSTTRIDVKGAAGGANVVSGGVPGFVVSHGKNGYGAYTREGARIALAAAGADEQENADDDTAFVSNADIDDQSTWIPIHILMYRMVSAGRLP